MNQFCNKSSLHRTELDGLRFFAFLLVFIHHLPAGASPIMAKINTLGWMGVDLFFVISSYLFFYLFKAEHKKAGRIDIGKFYLRRILRLYPLMMLAPLLALLVSPVEITDSVKAVGRYLGLGLFSDNILSALFGYNGTIPFIAHFWTLSFEFQVYIVMPFIFYGLLVLGERRFLQWLVIIGTLSIAARAAFLMSGAPPTMIWVTPFLRPESILIGLAIATSANVNINPAFPIIGGALALVVLLVGPNPVLGGPWLLVSYGLAAVFCGALVWLTLNVSLLAQVLRFRPLAYLGKISFGLYIFHLAAIYFANDWLGGDFRAAPGGYFGLLFLSLLLCVALAALSYHLLEVPFLRLKDRFAVVISRPV